MPTDQNLIIARLPRKERLNLLTRCTRVPLKMHEVLCHGDQSLKYVYFPIDGVISLVTLIDGKPALELGMVGREGLLGAQLALRVTKELWHALVQGEGTAWRIESAAFRRELTKSPALERTLERYLYVGVKQLATAAGCLHFHRIDERLARWLLMTQDRAESKHFVVTQEFLSFMLGVRRVSISTAAVALQRQGLITYSRGHLTVLNRKGLERAACSCYAADGDAYAEFLH